MAIWLFTLVVPAIMIVFGAYFMRRSPKDINMLFGYRTTLSMKNRDTWETAHRIIGRYWLIMGIVMLPVCVIPAIIATENDELMTVIMFITLVPLLLGIVLTEIRLHRIFDKDGNRR